MKNLVSVRSVCVIGLIWSLAGCGGASNTDSPTSSTAPLTLAELAPSLARELNTSLEAALKSGLGVASLEAHQPDTFLASLLRVLLPPVYAQTGFAANSRSGGTVRITSGYSTPGGGRVVFNNGQVTYSNWGYPYQGRVVVFSGTLTANGTWTAGAANNPVLLAGLLDVKESGGSAIGIGPIDCASLSTQVGCHGQVGGIQTGPADTPPSPNPNSCPASLSALSFDFGSGEGASRVTVTVGSTCPWTAGSNAGFITITAGASGRGNGVVNFSVSANAGASRIGSLSIAGLVVNVSQAAGTASTPTPTGVALYNGHYSGTMSGTVIYLGYPDTFTLPMEFTASNGAVTTQMGNGGSGTVNVAGAISFNWTTDKANIDVRGNVTAAGAASGTVSGTSADGTLNGTWTAARDAP